MLPENVKSSDYKDTNDKLISAFDQVFKFSHAELCTCQQHSHDINHLVNTWQHQTEAAV